MFGHDLLVTPFQSVCPVTFVVDLKKSFLSMGALLLSANQNM